MKHKHAQSPDDEPLDLDAYVAAQLELEDLKAQQGIAPKEGRISRMISAFFQRREEREKVLVNRKNYLWLTFLLGWSGAHRFRAKQYVLGTIYLLTCWTGFSIAMTIVDLMQILPIVPDEDGNILV